MNRLKSMLMLAMAAPCAAVAQNYVSEVWQPDLGTKFRNPIIYADYSDPDVCRVGDDYYMTASSFNCIPGLPILHSKDLVNWTLVNYAVERLVPAELFAAPSHGNGIWAPAIRHHNGEFYIYWGDPDNGIFMVKTKDVLGRWDDPVLVLPARGIIDTCPFWDEDGRAYLSHGYAGSRAGLKSILGIIEMTPDGTRTIGQSRIVFDGHEGNETVEGTKLYKRDGYYYILCPAGGVSTGWQLALRSKDIYGPYEHRKVMAQGMTDINGPHQGAWVDTPDGKEHWFIHFQDVDAYGRIIHLNPLRWADGWPVIGNDADGDGCGEPVTTAVKPSLPRQPKANPVETDYFTSNRLGLQWQWHANANPLWYFADAAHTRLRLFTVPLPENYANLWDLPNLLLQKFPAPDFAATARLRFAPSAKIEGERAGLVVMGMDYAGLFMEQTPRGILLSQNTCVKAKQHREEVVSSEPVLVQKNQDVWLRVRVSRSGTQALCRFSYSFDGKTFADLGREFTAQPGQWIGAKVGMFATRPKFINDGGWLDVEEFVVTR